MKCVKIRFEEIIYIFVFFFFLDENFITKAIKNWIPENS